MLEKRMGGGSSASLPSATGLPAALHNAHMGDHGGGLHGLAIEGPAHSRQEVRDGHTIARIAGGDVRMRKDLNLPSPIGHLVHALIKQPTRHWLEVYGTGMMICVLRQRLLSDNRADMALVTM